MIAAGSSYSDGRAMSESVQEGKATKLLRRSRAHLYVHASYSETHLWRPTFPPVLTLSIPSFGSEDVYACQYIPLTEPFSRTLKIDNLSRPQKYFVVDIEVTM